MIVFVLLIVVAGKLEAIQSNSDEGLSTRTKLLFFLEVSKSAHTETFFNTRNNIQTYPSSE